MERILSKTISLGIVLKDGQAIRHLARILQVDLLYLCFIVHIERETKCRLYVISK
jgi:hypothetical protein